ncbi:hypothetical protein N7466_010382 [Penicillium verhagenii]|uniref:uncharacterized protein n=1 Tax=Penicillium verhagenii TaxID=1562060 RepID=UPI002544F88C|nr:uncharacterized protein N7466_010382 [Penicillium verhagenii]KAJ5919439.1 hypothetical protein N7466_010382 [Penicillium verhagenii]
MAINLSRIYFLSEKTSSAAFLYQTQTLSHISRLSSVPPRTHRYYSIQHNGSGSEREGHGYSEALSQQDLNDTTKPSSQDLTQRRTSFLRHRGASVPEMKAKKNKQSPPKPKLRTITRNEREAFGGLMTRLKYAQSHQSAPLEGSDPDTIPNPDDLTAIMSVFESILEDNKVGSKQIQTTKKIKDSMPTDTREQDLVRELDVRDEAFSEVEEVRLSDLDLENHSASTDIDTVITMSEAINIIVERESKRIESELFQAVEDGKGDSGLWAVCRQRIFTMISHIGGPKAASAENTTENGSFSTVADIPPTSPSPGPLNIPPTVPPGPVVAKLYPKLLLLAFRILTTHFPESHLISQFRTAAKAQGRSSAFLGTSETLCDELMAFYWHRCNDLPAVVSFLRDMDNAGLDPSGRVRKLLRDIVRQHDLDMKSRKRAGGEYFWDAPPNKRAFQELAGSGGWIETIDSRRRQRRRTAIPVPRM